MRATVSDRSTRGSAAWGVPPSTGIKVVVSPATRPHVPADIHLKMPRPHAPEEMGLSKNYTEH